MREIRRNRAYVSVLLVATIGLGLASRRYAWLFPAQLGKYPGDALWAVMVYWVLALLGPSESTLKLALYALAASYADEFSQIYQAPWINQIRSTTLGHLILGEAFSWRDLLSYTVGIGILAPLEWLFLRRSESIVRRTEPVEG